MIITDTDTDTDTDTVAEAATHRTRNLILGWGGVLLLAVAATWNGGIAIDLMKVFVSSLDLVGGDDLPGDDGQSEVELDWLAMAGHAAATAAAGYLTWRTVRYQRVSRGSCGRCGRDDRPARDTERLAKRAAVVTVAPAAVYTALKVHWGFGGTLGIRDESVFDGVKPWSPGFGDTAILAAIGIGVALAMAYRRPRMPRWLLLTPGTIGCSMLVPVGVIGSAVMAAVALGVTEMPGEDADAFAPWIGAIYPLFLTWGIALTIVTAAYQFRTRPACRVCGRG